MIEVTEQINSVQRQVGSRMLEAGDARSMTISQTYDAPIDDVWDACTNPECIPRWFLPIMGLAIHLASGAAVDQAQAAQWVASGEGKRFISLSSERWRDANIAAGAPAPQARSVGSRATAAYTGAGEEGTPATD
jgi:hypothetical protein